MLPNLEGATIIDQPEELSIEQNRYGVFGRVNYAYGDKYLATASVRRDASSVFGPDRKFGTFPAFSVGWNLAREDFLLSSEFVSDLKFRASWGLTGTDNFNAGNIVENAFASLPLLQGTTALVNNTIQPGFSPQNIANPFLQWEASREINPGIDFGFLQGRVQGSLDVYRRTSDNLLLNNPVSFVTGFTDGLENRGELVNRGIEFELRTRNVTKEKFQWGTTIVATGNENELTEFGDANGQIIEGQFGRQQEWINIEGEALSSFYGFVIDEQLPIEFFDTPFFPINGNSDDIIVKDLNGDGIITDEDKTILGDPYPDLVWSMINNFNYGPVDLSVQVTGSHGAQVRNLGEEFFFTQFQGRTINPSDVVAAGIIPDASFLQRKVLTNDQVNNAGFFSLRNINLGLDFGKLGGGLFEDLKLSNARFFVTGQNVVFITDDSYQGFNPEFVDSSARIINAFGSQRGGSPIQRTFSAGLNVDF